MEFEISDDGEITRYNGKGGDVVIPEGVKFFKAVSGVIDHKAKITSIYLPKSFLGHRYRPFLEAYVFVFSEQENRVVERFMNDYRQRELIAAKGVYHYYSNLFFRSLVNYRVHPENPVYTERDGILYTKDGICLLGVPYKSTAKVIFDGNDVELNSQAIRYLKNDVVQAEVRGEILRKSTVYCVDDNINKSLVFFMPNVTRTDTYLKDKAILDKHPKAMFVAPKLKYAVHPYVKKQLALGYCFAPDLFDEIKACEYQEVLAINELDLYNNASNHKISEILDFYERLWDNWTLKDRPITSEQEACRYLFDTVMYGSDSDVQTALNLDYQFYPNDTKTYSNYHGAQTLAIACRYGGVNKLRALLDCSKFSAATKHCSHVESFVNEQMYLWICGYLCFNEVIAGTIPIAHNHEVRARQPLSEEERIECIELLIDRKVLTPAHVSILCFFALMVGDFKIASYLRAKGASFVEDHISSEEYMQNNFYKKALKYAIKKQEQGLCKLAAYVREDKGSLRLAEKELTSLMLTKSQLLYEILDVLAIAVNVMASLINKCITEGLSEPVVEFIKHDKIKNKASLDKFIQNSIDYEAPEITALLLEHKNNVFGTKSSNKGSKLKL